MSTPESEPGAKAAPAESSGARRPDHLMVLGVSRGGTTLVAAALGAHPAVAMLDEDTSGAFARVTGGKVGAVKLCVPNQIELTKRFRPVHRLGTWNGALRKSMLMNRVPRSPASLRDHEAMVNFTPVCVLRDAGAVIAAIVARENRRPAIAAYRWRRCLEVFEILAEERAGRADRPVFISFEKLVEAPEPTLRALAGALGLPWDAAMLEAPRRNRRYVGEAFDPARAAPPAGVDLSHLCERDFDRYERLRALAL